MYRVYTFLFFIFFKIEFQPMASAPDNNSLSSNLGNNRMLTKRERERDIIKINQMSIK